MALAPMPLDVRMHARSLCEDMTKDELRRDLKFQPSQPPRLLRRDECRIPLRCMVRALKKRRTNHFARSMVLYSVFLAILSGGESV